MTCLLLVAQISPLWFGSRDGLSYLSMARSIAAGQMPANLGRAHLHYAPGYSFFIAPVYWLSDYPFVWLSAVHAALGIATFWLCQRWLARQGIEDTTVLAATCAVNASVGILMRRTFSEALFMPGVLLVALILERLRADARDRFPIFQVLAAGLALAALCSTRQAGVMLLPGFAVALAMRVRQKDLPVRRAIAILMTVALPAVLAVGALMAYERTMVSAGGRTYTDYFASDAPWPLQLAEGVRLRINEIGRIILPGMVKASGEFGGVKTLNLAIYTIACALIMRGWWRSVRRTQDTLLWATPFYLGLYIVWPFDEGIRFLAPWAPVWFLGIYQALPEAPVFRRRTALLGWGLHVLMALGYWLGDDVPRAWRENRAWPELQAMAGAIDTGRDSVGWLPAKTDRQRLMLAYELDRQVVDLVPTDGSATNSLEWVIAAADDEGPNDFQRIAKGKAFSLWRRSR